jgi:hypothetical protein
LPSFKASALIPLETNTGNVDLTMSLRMLNDVLKLRDLHDYCPLCGRAFGKVASNDEHVFPRWLQHHHNLWTRELKLPNFIGRRYKSIKVKVCVACNNIRFGQLEMRISRLVCTPDPYESLRNLDDDDVVIWLGKMFWLLCRKSNASVNPKSLSLAKPEEVVSNDVIRGTTYLGMMERAFAMKKGMYACYRSDPPIPEYFYGEPYSLYRFRIDTRDARTEAFDFKDNVAVLGASLRTGTFGMVCVFDGGMHRRFRSHWLDFLTDKALHPPQFNEVIGRIFYDQTVLNQEANQVTYFWNRQLRSVVAMTFTPRSYNPYLQKNHDVKESAHFIARYVGADPSALLSRDGRHLLTSLQNRNGRFYPYPINAPSQS